MTKRGTGRPGYNPEAAERVRRLLSARGDVTSHLTMKKIKADD
jgi:hypothetical protein